MEMNQRPGKPEEVVEMRPQAIVLAMVTALLAAACGSVAPLPIQAPVSELYASNFNANSVTVHGAGANGNVAPTRTIVGPSVGLNLPIGLALDSAGNIYVANFASNTVGGPRDGGERECGADPHDQWRGHGPQRSTRRGPG